MEKIGQLSVLVVDDEPGIREVMALELEMNGYSVLTASNGRAAFEIIESCPVHCVISDVRMPDEDGLELLEKIRERCLRTGVALPVILMTGFSSVRREDALARGAVEVLLKPFLMEELMNLIPRESLK